MNLSTITLSPFVQGIIHVESQVDADGQIRTSESFEILNRTHDKVASLVDRPTLEKHALHAKVAALPGNENGISEIPIRMFFNKAESAISIGYRAYAKETGQPLCSGDGKTAKRFTTAADHTATLTEHPCPGCDMCSYADQSDVSCYRQVRMPVQVEGQDDDLSVFEIRSTSINTYRALRAQLAMIEKRLKGLRHVPLTLKLWKTSNALSQYEAFHCMRVEYRSGNEVEAFQAAENARKSIAESGLDDAIDDVFEAQDASAGFFESDDVYAVTLGLGERHARRSGTNSVAVELVAKSAGQFTPGDDNTPLIRSAADMIAMAVCSPVEVV